MDRNMSSKITTFLLSLFVTFQWACAQDPQAAKGPAQSQAETPKQTQRMTNEQISTYVRKAMNIPSNVTVTITENESKIPGLQGILIELRWEKGIKKQQAWVTEDNLLILGQTFDMTVDPYKKNWEKISFSDVPTTGFPEAKVTIVEYSDFQCPFCSQAHVTVKELLKQYEGKVKLIYKHLPLEIHNWAQAAAVAAACVYEQNPDAFWKLSDFLFTNQKTLTKDTLGAKILDFSKESNLNSDQLQKCINDPATSQLVKANMAEASTLGLNSTPSFVINGRLVVGAQKLEQFKQIIDEALAAAN